MPHGDEFVRAPVRRRARRRARILAFLVATAVGTGVAAALRGGALWELHLLCDLGLGLYAILLFDASRRRRDTIAKVRPLHARRQTRVHEFEPLRRRA